MLTATTHYLFFTGTMLQCELTLTMKLLKFTWTFSLLFKSDSVAMDLSICICSLLRTWNLVEDVWVSEGPFVTVVGGS